MAVDSAFVVVTNLVPLYGVWFKGWNAFLLILLFIVEGIVVVLTDGAKQAVMPAKARRGFIGIEFLFICFYGLFAILIFGRDGGSGNLYETATSAFRNASALPLWPVASIAAMRVARTVRDLFAAGAFGGERKEALAFHGVGWMLLLFFLVMSAPMIAGGSPNPTRGLVVVVALKMLGELLEVWASRVPGGRRRGRSGQDPAAQPPARSS